MIANANSWKILPMPKEKALFPFEKSYSLADFEKIRIGFIPKVMEHKWFIYYDDPWLFFHRSWSGIGMYQIHFLVDNTAAIASESYRSGLISDYTESSQLHDRKLLEKLIDMLLLNKPKSYY